MALAAAAIVSFRMVAHTAIGGWLGAACAIAAFAVFLAVFAPEAWKWWLRFRVMPRVQQARVIADIMGPIALLLGAFGFFLPFVAFGMAKGDQWEEATVTMLIFVAFLT